MEGVAILRGKGMPTKVFHQDKYESPGDFMSRVVEWCAGNLDLHRRNTLTIEYVWGA